MLEAVLLSSNFTHTLETSKCSLRDTSSKQLSEQETFCNLLSKLYFFYLNLTGVNNSNSSGSVIFKVNNKTVRSFVVQSSWLSLGRWHQKYTSLHSTLLEN